MLMMAKEGNYVTGDIIRSSAITEIARVTTPETYLSQTGRTQHYITDRTERLQHYNHRQRISAALL